MTNGRERTRRRNRKARGMAGRTREGHCSLRGAAALRRAIGRDGNGFADTKRGHCIGRPFRPHNTHSNTRRSASAAPHGTRPRALPRCGHADRSASARRGVGARCSPDGRADDAAPEAPWRRAVLNGHCTSATHDPVLCTAHTPHCAARNDTPRNGGLRCGGALTLRLSGSA